MSTDRNRPRTRSGGNEAATPGTRTATPGNETATPAAGTGTPGTGNATPREGFLARHRRAALSVLFGAAALGFAYYVVPQIAGLGATLRRLRSGDPWWLALGVGLEAISIAGYIWLFRGVFKSPGGRIGWKASYQITMAGGAATKVFAAAGAGGVALTVWALRASGLDGATVARRMVGFEILNYAVYMVALVVAGFGLRLGLFAGKAPLGLTVVPAAFGLVVIALAVSMLWIAGPVESRMLGWAKNSHGRVARFWKRAAGYPRAVEGGLRFAIALVRRGDRSWLGAILGWAFDIGALWASFRAFGHSPPGAVLVMGYYVGTLANALPLPGGIGGVEGGMIGAFVGFGVSGPLAVIAVLGYRTISYWVPAIPETVAYVQLRHTAGRWRAAATRPAGPSKAPAPSAT